MDSLSFFVPLLGIAILVWFAYNIIVIGKKRNVVAIERKKRQSRHHAESTSTIFDVRITLDDLEKMFWDGKERTYETPYGVLYACPDERHVVAITTKPEQREETNDD